MVDYLTANENVNHFNAISDISIRLYLDLSHDISQTELDKLKSLQEVIENVSNLIFVIDVNHILAPFVKIMDDWCEQNYISTTKLELNSDHRIVRKITC